MMLKKALFLDRDGTMIIDTDYPTDPDKVEFVPGTTDALRQIQKEFELFVISNQSGVGRGIISLDQFEKVHNRLLEKLEEENIDIAGFYYCLHAPEENCDCRKPSPKLILNAAGEHDIDLTSSFMIGDKMSDVVAGQRAGCQTILIRTQDRSVSDEPKAKNIGFIAKDLEEAIKWILTKKN